LLLLVCIIGLYFKIGPKHTETIKENGINLKVTNLKKEEDSHIQVFAESDAFNLFKIFLGDFSEQILIENDSEQILIKDKE
jgi:hypothetical protein